MSQRSCWNPQRGGHPASLELSELLSNSPRWDCCPLKSPTQISQLKPSKKLPRHWCSWSKPSPYALLVGCQFMSPQRSPGKGFSPLCGRLWLDVLGSAHGSTGAQGSFLQHVDILQSSSSLPWHSPSWLNVSVSASYPEGSHDSLVSAVALILFSSCHNNSENVSREGADQCPQTSKFYIN